MPAPRLNKLKNSQATEEKMFTEINSTNCPKVARKRFVKVYAFSTLYNPTTLNRRPNQTKPEVRRYQQIYVRNDVPVGQLE